jgi:hypothetical protein
MEKPYYHRRWAGKKNICCKVIIIFTLVILRIFLTCTLNTNSLRKIASAILICLLLFNWFGYNLVADYLQQKSDKHLEAHLDQNQYDESQLIELKIPLNLPYQTSWSAFERYDGEIKLNGILYKYVKRKVANDTLFLMCIPNHQKMDLQTAKEDYFKNTNDLSQTSTSKKTGSSKSGAFKKLMNEYDENVYAIGTKTVLNNNQNFGITYSTPNLLSSPHISPEQPPDIKAA